MANAIKANTITPLHKTVFVKGLDSGVKLSKGGIILMDDNMTERGIRPRWGQVYSVGPEVDDLKPGEWVLVEHGRWTNAIDIAFPDGDERLWRIDYPDAILLVSSEDPRDTTAHAL